MLGQAKLGIAFRSAAGDNFLQVLTFAEKDRIAAELRQGIFAPQKSDVVKKLPPKVFAPLRETNSFYLKTSARHCTLELNGKRVWDNEENKLMNLAGPRSHIGFATGTPKTGSVSTVISYEFRRHPPTMEPLPKTPKLPRVVDLKPASPARRFARVP